MKKQELANIINENYFISIKEFSRKTNIYFTSSPVKTERYGTVVVETYEVQCDDGILIIKGAAIGYPDWTDFSIGYVTAFNNE